MCNYYAKFVHAYANTAAPLYALLHKDVTWEWSDAQQRAFEALKHALCEAPVLALPNFNKPFTIETDASDTAIGGVLM